ncbi:coatomer epsilon subunit-domain-containing protein [Naematelia encephala]|uniref:Coatomer subunit epsilon n=1 Tax=Naematelia encephala TaxID=71784 RepID=A0A1Y2APZ4_9TREE|nr:coatomer epsilon subunit-domain-containing protein [Naematelia encephala]
MEADPLYHVKQLFYQSSYKACISEASSQSVTPSDDDPLPLERALYISRSHLALSPPSTSDAISILTPFTSLDPAPLPARAGVAFAEYLAAPSSEGVDAVRDLLLEAEGEQGESTVRVIAGTVFILEKENEEAVATLTEGTAKEDLECMALLVQLLLSLDRRDLAHATYATAKKIGNDSMLVQAMEAWIGLKAGARPLHQAYYFFEELYQLPSGRTGPVLASHAAAHLLLSHVDEAKADILEAEQGSYAQDENVLAVGAALGMEGYAAKLASSAPKHPLAVDLEEKSSLFDDAASKFAIAT